MVGVIAGTLIANYAIINITDKIHKLAAKEALIMYAQKHDDFSDLLAEAAFDNLFDTILTDDLFKPVEGFTPTDEERAKMEEAEKTAKALSGLFDILKNI